jgi:DNA-binding transcriptional ArsR family regulator
MSSSQQDTPQQDLFNHKAETTWFHMFHTMFSNGDVATMGPSAFACYCAIKMHTSFNTGESFPGHETIAKLAGVSEATIKRHLGTLVKLGYVTITKKGRKNYYKLREKIAVKDEHGRPAAVATWDYVPSSVQAAVADLKNVLVTGKIGEAKMVAIEHITINVNSGSGTQINIDMSKVNDARTRSEVAELLKAAGVKGEKVIIQADEDNEPFQQ